MFPIRIDRRRRQALLGAMLEHPNLPDLARRGIGVVIFCGTRLCPRASQYIPIDQALATFGPVTLRQASRRLRCETCGATGENGQVHLAVSSLDVSEMGHGRPPGQLERRNAERSIEEVAADRALHAANGWAYRESFIPPTPWW